MTLVRHSPGFELKMTFTPGMVSVVRCFVEQTVEQMGVEASAGVNVAMAVHELGENVAKYASDGYGTVCVQVAPDGARARLVVTVSNEATPEGISRLKGFFEQMTSAVDPMTHYFSLMARVTPPGESGLGLARIRAEADMSLDLTVTGNRVS